MADYNILSNELNSSNSSNVPDILNRNKSKNEILTSLSKIIIAKIPDKYTALLIDFAKIYFSLVSAEDLITHKVEDLYGALLSHWNFLNATKPGNKNIRVYNPSYEQHGWSSPHTIIEVVCPDHPFVVNSIRQKLFDMNIGIYLIISANGVITKRNKNNDISDIKIDYTQVHKKELLIYLEIDKQVEQNLININQEISSILNDINIVVRDWSSMVSKAEELLEDKQKYLYNNDSLFTEYLQFIQWLIDDKFIFLGCCDYKFLNKSKNKTPVLKIDEKSGLGYLAKDSRFTAKECFAGWQHKIEELTSGKDCILIAKSNVRSTVHRRAYLDYIPVALSDNKGNIIGERRFLGLFTSSAYHTGAIEVPLLRNKIKKVMDFAGLNWESHTAKQILNILESLLRDDLFQSSPEELVELAFGIFHMQDRRQIKLFIRRDKFGGFFSCILCIPKDVYNNKLRKEIGNFLKESLEGEEITFTTNFSESILAKIYFVIRLPANTQPPRYSINELQQKIIDMAKTWGDKLKNAMLEHYGEEKGNSLYFKYCDAFPASYHEYFQPYAAVYDIQHMEELKHDNSISMFFYNPLEDSGQRLRFKLFRKNNPVPLSDVLPILENMGMTVLSEHSHKISLTSNETIWINDFVMLHEHKHNINLDNLRNLLQDCFLSVWQEKAENDSLNKLVLLASLSWREISILRAYSRYMRQIKFTFSEAYINNTLTSYADIAKDLIKLFMHKFSLKNLDKQDQDNVYVLEEGIRKSLNEIDNLDQDRICRRFLDVISATVRTNYFQVTSDNKIKDYISFKIKSSLIPDIPLPCPMFEIFVYSTLVEGVHLRGGKFSRGGLRWSTRIEDFRTETLDLVKAQNVKNAVIVPTGAKGGFVVKKLDTLIDRQHIQEEIASCYSMFIRGLLDITDNLKNSVVIKPKKVICLDEDDTYLVVAADKGTATFSDIANKIAAEYDFWLGDAFASGGSNGYDHKKMGITARGAWESVKRHFCVLSKDIDTSPFTVIGIGDMGGDVFGNGMLLSSNIKLVAAFNHLHIFIDPNPDPAISFTERQRLYNLPNSTWNSYDSKLISSGGGVYSRSAKLIKISAEAQKVLGTTQSEFVPSELIKVILQAPVDLLWNGGIGTYVKAIDETHDDVGDRNNDALRINGYQLRCKIVGEGGNLGLTQLGRIEAALNGIISFTDFIDNAGGVDCSDHEVNIKILLDDIVKNGDLTLKQRNTLLVEMTEEIAELVLKNNYDQSLSISLASSRASETLDEHARFIENLEKYADLDRELEFLPNDEMLAERKHNGIGLTRPEISILNAYSKIMLKAEISKTNLADDPDLQCFLSSAFPQILHKRFAKEMINHKLCREIITTQLSNMIVNRMGITFVQRLFDETGASISDIVRSYIIIDEILDVDNIWRKIANLDNKIECSLQNRILLDLIRLVRRLSRWILRNRRKNLRIKPLVEYFKPKLLQLIKIMPYKLQGEDLKMIDCYIAEYLAAGIDKDLVSILSILRPLYSSMDIIEVAYKYNIDLEEFAEAYFALGDKLELGWFRIQLSHQPVDDTWDALARSACRDDIDHHQSDMAIGVLKFCQDSLSLNDKIEHWLNAYQTLVSRWQEMIVDLKTTKSREFTIFAVALRDLLDLAQSSRFGAYSNTDTDEANKKEAK